MYLAVLAWLVQEQYQLQQRRLHTIKLMILQLLNKTLIKGQAMGKLTCYDFAQLLHHILYRCPYFSKAGCLDVISWYPLTKHAL